MYHYVVGAADRIALPLKSQTKSPAAQSSLRHLSSLRLCVLDVSGALISFLSPISVFTVFPLLRGDGAGTVCRCINMSPLVQGLWIKNIQLPVRIVSIQISERNQPCSFVQAVLARWSLGELVSKSLPFHICRLWQLVLPLWRMK